MAGLIQQVTTVFKSYLKSWRNLMRPAILLLVLAASAFGLYAHASEQASADQSSPCAKKRSEPYHWEGYNNKPVNACLGPHLYRIPANYFDDQMGPDFQGNVTLKIMWPNLQPLPPGQHAGKDFPKEITISPDYIDRVPIEGLLNKDVGPHSWDHAYEWLNSRDEQPQRFGLTPYYVNRKKFEAFWERQAQIDAYKSNVHLENERDWYLHYDTQGQLRTVIKCDSHLTSDGYIIQDDKVLRTKDGSAAVCDHFFTIPEDNIMISVIYQRIFIKDWKRIEDCVRELFARYRVY